MVTVDQFRDWTLSFPGTEEQPHFDRAAFKVVKRRIFATLHEKSRTANLKFSAADQEGFCSLNPAVVFPVANKWGVQGWTTIELDKAEEGLVKAALETAYKDVVKGKPRK